MPITCQLVINIQINGLHERGDRIKRLRKIIVTFMRCFGAKQVNGILTLLFCISIGNSFAYTLKDHTPIAKRKDNMDSTIAGAMNARKIEYVD